MRKAKRDAFDGHSADTILEVIRSFLSQADENSMFSLWRQTQTEMGDVDDDECLFRELVRMDLEMELLRQITNLAWEEAKKGT